MVIGISHGLVTPTTFYGFTGGHRHLCFETQHSLFNKLCFSKYVPKGGPKSFQGKQNEFQTHPKQTNKSKNYIHMNKILANCRSTALQRQTSSNVNIIKMRISIINICPLTYRLAAIRWGVLRHHRVEAPEGGAVRNGARWCGRRRGAVGPGLAHGPWGVCIYRHCPNHRGNSQ